MITGQYQICPLINTIASIQFGMLTEQQATQKPQVQVILAELLALVEWNKLLSTPLAFGSLSQT